MKRAIIFLISVILCMTVFFTGCKKTTNTVSSSNSSSLSSVISSETSSLTSVQSVAAVSKASSSKASSAKASSAKVTPPKVTPVKTSSAPKVSSVAPVSSPAASSAVNTPVSSTVSQPTVQQFADELQNAFQVFSDETMDVNVYAQGNTLVMNFKCKVEIEDISAVKPELEGLLEQFGEDITPLLDEMKAAGISNPSVMAQFLDMNGNVICSKEYK